MSDYDNITTAKDIREAFDFLKSSGTLIRMVSDRAGFERLIIVTDIRTTLTGRMVVLDAPKDLDAIVLPEELPSFRFEYTGPDGIKYLFASDRPQLKHDGLWIAVPRVIERIQRRSDFRVIAPMDTWLTFTLGELAVRAKVIDLSLGGARCHVTIGRYGHTAGLMENGMKLVGLDLTIPHDDRAAVVHIHTSRIAWISKDPAAGRIMVAISFAEMERLAAARLTREIYRIQREELRLRQSHS